MNNLRHRYAASTALACCLSRLRARLRIIVLDATTLRETATSMHDPVFFELLWNFTLSVKECGAKAGANRQVDEMTGRLTDILKAADKTDTDTVRLLADLQDRLIVLAETSNTRIRLRILASVFSDCSDLLYSWGRLAGHIPRSVANANEMWNADTALISFKGGLEDE